MSIRAKQVQFMKDVVFLIDKAFELGYEVTAGELFRTPEQQAIYVKTGRSKTLKSKHLERLAIDLNVFKDGKLCSVDEIAPLGDYWESLTPGNLWGGRWNSLKDGPHFQAG